MYYKIICLSIGLVGCINAMELKINVKDKGKQKEHRTTLDSLNIDEQKQPKRVILPASLDKDKSIVQPSIAPEQKRKRSLKFPLKLSSLTPRSSSHSHSEDSSSTFSTPQLSPKFMNPKSDDLSFLLCFSDLNPNEELHNPYMNLGEFLVKSKDETLGIAKKCKLQGTKMYKIYKSITKESIQDPIILGLINIYMLDLYQYQECHDLLNIIPLATSQREINENNAIKEKCYELIRGLSTQYWGNQIKFPTYHCDGEEKPLLRFKNPEKYVKQLCRNNNLSKEFTKPFIATKAISFLIPHIEHNHAIKEKISQLYNADRKRLKDRLCSTIRTINYLEQLEQ